MSAALKDYTQCSDHELIEDLQTAEKQEDLAKLYAAKIEYSRRSQQNVDRVIPVIVGIGAFTSIAFGAYIFYASSQETIGPFGSFYYFFAIDPFLTACALAYWLKFRDKKKLKIRAASPMGLVIAQGDSKHDMSDSDLERLISMHKASSDPEVLKVLSKEKAFRSRQ